MLFIDHQFNVLDALALQDHPPSVLIDFLLFATLTFPVGAGMLIVGLNNVLEAAQSESWPTAPGKVLRSEVVEVAGRDTRNNPEVTFEYEVSQKRYEGATIRNSQPNYYFRDNAQSVVDRYPVGREVKVHYDPTQPDNSVLDTSGVAAYRLILWGMAWVLFPCVTFFPFIRDWLHS